MAKSKNNLSGILNELSRGKTRESKGSSSFAPTNLVGQGGASESGNSPSLRDLGDTRRSSIGGRVTPEGIKFGRPSSSGQKASASGSEWTNLLKQTASGGIASAFSGGFGGIGGLGALVSGFMGLFGGGGNKNALPPLVEFQLPSPEQETIYVSSGGSRVYQGSAVQSSNAGSSGGTQTSGSASDAQWIQEQSAQIAQAVKTAILNSSSLNDVIAEI